MDSSAPLRSGIVAWVRSSASRFVRTGIGAGRASQPPGDGRVGAARDRLLDVLIHRRLVDVDEGDRIRLREMPLGYWPELDGLDQREWRRVLEYRHVGWREFDENDKQVR